MTQSSDWFVAAAAGARGDGSRDKPFHDPWLAFRRAEPGDTIHIATGTYFGRFDRSSWIIDCPGLTIRGGYSRDFTTRTPWKTPSILAFYSGYEYTRENNLIAGRGNHSTLVIDGVFFDAAGRNTYEDKPGEGITWFPNMEGPIASFNAENVTIRNCIFANSANGGVELAGAGSRFENNLMLNMIGLAMLDLRSSTQMISQAIAVVGNTFCFMHDTGDPAGKGGDRSHGIRINCPAVVENNVFVSCGNSAISAILEPARISIDRNLFFATPHDVIESRALGSSGEITEKNFEELEDLGFKSCGGNIIQDPTLTGLPTEWLDTYSRHLLGRYATPPRDAANAFRAVAGLPVLAPVDLEKQDQKGALAPRFPESDAVALSAGVKQGFHPIEMPVEIAPHGVAPAFEYRRIEWTAITTPDPSLANIRVELRAGLGMEQNSFLLADAGPETHMGVRIYEPGSDDSPIFVLIRRNTFPTRQYSESTTYNRGMEVESTYYLRGIYRTDIGNSRQKATLVVESLAPAPMLAPELPARPIGRGWFVRAGSSGGDGTREKPFRDPFQALEKAEGGDTIHVAAGDYFGKLRSGKWTISIRNLALLGGYDADFANRDPWSNPTRFLFNEEQKAKGRPEGTLLFSEENSDGLIVDGFIFDGASWNSYKDGSLDLETSPLAPLISLRGLSAPITVRNCLFVNASDGAAIIACPLIVFENNIIINTSGDALVIRANGAGPTVIRNNTFLFACDPTPRAGTGKSSSRGTLVQLTGRAAMALESNIFAFADNFGVRAAVPQKNVALSNNVFAANLYNHIADANYLWADGSNWERRVIADSDYALEGNRLSLLELPVDPAFADVALARLFALPSCISKDEWKIIAAAIDSSAAPSAAEESAAAKPETEATPAGASPIDDILARINRTQSTLQEATAKPEPAAGPLYCPVFDYRKALALARDASEPHQGARKQKLSVSFTAAQSPKPTVEYTRINAAEVDANRASLDDKPVEIEVTHISESSANPSLFPAGTDKNNFKAYSVTAAESETRTRLAIVAKDDTDAGKRIRRSISTDKLRIRGRAYNTSGSSGLSILVDSVEAAGN